MGAFLSGKKTYLAATSFILISIAAFLDKGAFDKSALFELGKLLLIGVIPIFMRMGIAGNVPSKP